MVNSYCHSCDYCNYCDSCDYCYSCDYCHSCDSCKFCKNLVHGFMCINLKFEEKDNTKFWIFNKEVTKKDWDNRFDIDGK